MNNPFLSPLEQPQYQLSAACFRAVDRAGVNETTANRLATAGLASVW